MQWRLSDIMQHLRWATCLFFLSVVFSSTSYAMYCHGENAVGFIDVGDTTEAVLSACGQPSKVQQQDEQDSAISTTLYWTYFNSATSVNPYNPQGNINPVDVESTGPTVVFEIKSGKVTRISVNGAPMSSTAQCPKQQNVSIGYTPQQVQMACGVPDSLDTQNQPEQAKPEKVEVWTYDYGAGSPPLLLSFKNGKLLSINQGS